MLMDQQEIIKYIDKIVVSLEDLRSKIGTDNASKKKIKNAIADKNVLFSEEDFGKNPRAFFKKYAKDLSGPKKFVLCLAYLVKGDSTDIKTLDEVSAIWSSVHGLMGADFKRMYGTRAKEYDWVDSPKTGSYTLNPNWSDIFK